MDEKTKRLLTAQAEKAAGNAHCPYSGYAVGAAVLTGDGVIYCGCNVENASYSLTMCAERVALFKAVADGHKKITAVCVCASGKLPYPCGACRQALGEFCDDAIVIVTNGKETREHTLKELMPYGFR